MLRRIWDFIKSDPPRTIMGISLMLGLVSLLLVGLAVREDGAAADLAGQVVELEASLEQLKQTDEEGLQSLENDLADAEGLLRSLQQAFPAQEAAYDIYRRSAELAASNQVEFLSITRGENFSVETSIGNLDLTAYTLQGSASLDHCQAFIADIEAEGLRTLTVEGISIDPLVNSCVFGVDVVQGSTVTAE